MVELLLFRGLLDIAQELALSEQRLLAILAVLGLLLGALVLELGVYRGLLGAGRHFEVRLRLDLFGKVARLGDRYFRSRLNSDMAERAHSVHKLRLLPELAGQVARVVFQLGFLAIGIAWIEPRAAPLAVLAVVVAVVLPLAAQPHLTERDLRMRNHAGALSRFYLDAFLGLVPIRNHGAEPAVRPEHESLLTEWVRSALRLERSALGLDLLQALCGYGFAAWIVFRHVSAPGEATEVLLLAYWAINIQMLGQQLAILGRHAPLQKNTAIRLLEPLRAPEEVDARYQEAAGEGADEGDPRSLGPAVVLEKVGVVAAGHEILRDVSLTLKGGSQVAVVGPSGAGKSSLLGILLGWHRPSHGRVLIGGEPLDGESLRHLRPRTVWVDPSVQLWNRSLLANLVYGAPDGSEHRISQVTEEAFLMPILQGLPEGFRTRLGEGGGLVSGGEGQRVRLGRGLLRRKADLVILDEPFRGLDRSTRSELLSRIRSWWKGATLLCVTHDIAETTSFDEVLVVEEGTVCETGEPERLLRQPGSRYRALLEAEARVQHRFTGQGEWRRLKVEGGALSERSPRGEHGR